MRDEKRSRAEVMKDWMAYVNAQAGYTRGYSPLDDGFNAAMEREYNRSQDLPSLDPGKVADAVLGKGLTFDDVANQHGVSWTDLRTPATSGANPGRILLILTVAVILVVLLFWLL